MTVKAVVEGTKDVITQTIGAPTWVKQIAESIMVVAVSLSAIGIDFAPYFSAMSEVSIMEMKAELKNKYPQTDSLTVILVNKLELRIKELEENTHKARH